VSIACEHRETWQWQARRVINQHNLSLNLLARELPARVFIPLTRRLSNGSGLCACSMNRLPLHASAASYPAHLAVTAINHLEKLLHAGRSDQSFARLHLLGRLFVERSRHPSCAGCTTRSSRTETGEGRRESTRSPRELAEQATRKKVTHRGGARVHGALPRFSDTTARGRRCAACWGTKKRRRGWCLE